MSKNNQCVALEISNRDSVANIFVFPNYNACAMALHNYIQQIGFENTEFESDSTLEQCMEFIQNNEIMEIWDPDKISRYYITVHHQSKTIKF